MIELKRGDVLRVKEEFEVRAAQYTEDGTLLWSMVATIGAGCELFVVGAAETWIRCRAVDHHDNVVTAHIFLNYNPNDIDWDRVEIIKGK